MVIYAKTSGRKINGLVLAVACFGIKKRSSTVDSFTTYYKFIHQSDSSFGA